MGSKVLVCDSVAKSAIQMMESQGLTVDVKTGLNENELVAIIGDYNAAIVRSATKLTAPVLKAGKNLKVVIRGGVGIDNIDCKTAEELGIKVANTPDASTNSVAELAVGMMFSMARFIPQADASMKNMLWEKKKFQGSELAGKTLALLGTGRIGTSTAQKAAALGMNIIGVRRSAPGIKPLDPIIKQVTLDEALAQADFISLHMPFNKKEPALIGKEQFKKMKKGVFIVNVARGGIIDESALIEALDDGTVAMAALDVWLEEPTKNEKLATHSKVVALPHLGASTKEGQERVGTAAAEIAINALTQDKRRSCHGSSTSVCGCKAN